MGRKQGQDNGMRGIVPPARAVCAVSPWM